MQRLTDGTPQKGMGDLVVAELRLMYGSRFAQAWEGLTPGEMKASWNQKLAGYSEADIRVGLVACLAKDWPPTLPEFMKLCQPWTDPEVAFHEAVAGMSARKRGELGVWSHPSIFHAARSVGTHDLLNCGYSVMKSRWERAFREELARGRWDPVTMPAAALPAPGGTLATREDADKAMAKMGAAGVINQKGKDPRRWAKKIMTEQERKGGRRYSPEVLRMVRVALDAAPDTGEAA